jgi:hypothetical protein
VERHRAGESENRLGKADNSKSWSENWVVQSQSDCDSLKSKLSRRSLWWEIEDQITFLFLESSGIIKTVDLTFAREVFEKLVGMWVLKRNRFPDNLALTSDHYFVREPVLANSVCQFASALAGKTGEMMNENTRLVFLLCDEFAFASLAERLSAFRWLSEMMTATHRSLPNAANEIPTALSTPRTLC